MRSAILPMLPRSSCFASPIKILLTLLQTEMGNSSMYTSDHRGIYMIYKCADELLPKSTTLTMSSPKVTCWTSLLKSAEKPVSQGFDSHQGQLAHLTILQSFNRNLG